MLHASFKLNSMLPLESKFPPCTRSLTLKGRQHRVFYVKNRLKNALCCAAVRVPSLGSVYLQYHVL